MTTVLSEVRERFLLAIVKQVPAERIAEIHFFQPLKQGGVESGVAVVAAWPEPRGEAKPLSHSERSEESADGESDPSVAALPQDDPSVILSEAKDPSGADGVILSEAKDRSDADDVILSEAKDPSGADDVILSEAKDRSDAAARHVIYTARYRYTLKGPDRGKWESNVVAEADAPLVTVEAVVRGVQRRAGDADDPARMDGDEVRAIVDARLAALAAAAPPKAG